MDVCNTYYLLILLFCLDAKVKAKPEGNLTLCYVLSHEAKSTSC